MAYILKKAGPYQKQRFKFDETEKKKCGDSTKVHQGRNASTAIILTTRLKIQNHYFCLREKKL